MEFVIGWLIFAVIVGVIAGSRKRSGFGWFLLAVLISPLLALILVLALGVPKPPAEATKKCPQCAEFVKADAAVCRYCGHQFTASGARQSQNLRVAQPVTGIIAGDGQFRFEVAGEASYQNALAQIAGPKQPKGINMRCAALLVPEPDNPYDAGAVRVDIDGLTVGYVPREATRALRAALEAGPYTAGASGAAIVGGWDRGDGDTGSYGVKLDIAMPFRLSAPPVSKQSPSAARANPPARRKGVSAGLIVLLILLGGVAYFLARNYAAGPSPASPTASIAPKPAPVSGPTATAAPAKQAPPPEPADSWNTRVTQSPVDDSTSVFVQTRAIDTIDVRFSSHRPTLTLRCVENTTAAIINFDGAFVADIEGYGTVTFRVDDRASFDRRLQESTSNEALGFWSGGNAIPFIRQLFGGQTLLVRATPFNESPVVFSFNIRNVENAVAELRKTCGW